MDKLENEEMQVVSYVKLKNISFHPTEIQGRLYLKDTMGELQEKYKGKITLFGGK